MLRMRNTCTLCHATKYPKRLQGVGAGWLFGSNCFRANEMGGWMRIKI